MAKNQKPAGVGGSNWPVRWGAAALVTAFILIAFEGLAWGVYSQRDYVRDLLRDIGGIGGVGQLQLDSYEMVDPVIPGHWRLRPNFVASSAALVAEKRDAGKWLGAAAIQNAQDTDNKSILKINSAGFKGSELDATHRCPRVLMLGDSVTFGVGAFSYPNFVRTTFLDSNIKAEVVNGGVEGYDLNNILNELPRYLALKPEIVTIYIGWNVIFATDIDAIAAAVPLKSVWLIRHALDAIYGMIGDGASNATHAYQKKLNANPESPVIAKVRDHRFESFRDIRKIIDAFRSIDSEVYLITLMGLFQADLSPSPAALSIGHLPAGTDNPFVFAALTNQANDELKSAVSGDGVHLIDLQAWGRENLQPPSSYFLDSVHFNSEGLKEVGGYLASKLAKPVRARDTGCHLEE